MTLLVINSRQGSIRSYILLKAPLTGSDNVIADVSRKVELIHPANTFPIEIAALRVFIFSFHFYTSFILLDSHLAMDGHTSILDAKDFANSNPFNLICLVGSTHRQRFCIQSNACFACISAIIMIDIE